MLSFQYMTNILKPYSIPLAIIIGGALIAGALFFTGQFGSGDLTLKEASDKAINFINQSIEEDVTATLIETTDEGDVYRLRLTIVDTEYEAYITKDGNFIFPTGINLKDFASQAQPSPTPEAATTTAALDTFAQCLTDKGMKFYGSKNCSWCAKEKTLFGDSLQYVNYVECVGDDGQWAKACQDAKINAVPTWQLPDGQMESGYKTLEQLAEKSGCQLQ